MKPLFTKDELAAWAGLIVAQSKIFRRVEEDLEKRMGLTHPEYEVLLRLADAPEHRLRLQALAEASLLSRSGLSRAVDRLVKAGHVARTHAEEDGRGANAALTQQGMAHLVEARRGHVDLVRHVFLGRFTSEEIVQLGQLFQRFRTLD
jgi:DNA-binding MarR family transcriptional regulator